LVDLLRFLPKGLKNFNDLVYVPKVKEVKFTLINPKMKLTFEDSWDSELFGSLRLLRSLGNGSSYQWYGLTNTTSAEITTSIPSTGLCGYGFSLISGCTQQYKEALLYYNEKSINSVCP